MVSVIKASSPKEKTQAKKQHQKTWRRGEKTKGEDEVEGSFFSFQDLNTVRRREQGVKNITEELGRREDNWLL